MAAALFFYLSVCIKSIYKTVHLYYIILKQRVFSPPFSMKSAPGSQQSFHRGLLVDLRGLLCFVVEYPIQDQDIGSDKSERLCLREADGIHHVQGIVAGALPFALVGGVS